MIIHTFITRQKEGIFTLYLFSPSSLPVSVLLTLTDTLFSGALDTHFVTNILVDFIVIMDD